MKSDFKEYQKKLESLEKQKYWSEVTERLAKSQKITEEITQTEDYINWLENFTIENKSFSDDSWLYCPENISIDDKDKVSKLNNFYDVIQVYANKNYIYATPNNFGKQYYVKHNNIGYEVGIMVGQGTTFFVKRQRITRKNSDFFLDFKLIQENKITARAEMIRNKLVALGNLIDDISNSVPVEAIEETTQKRLQLLKEKI